MFWGVCVLKTVSFDKKYSHFQSFCMIFLEIFPFARERTVSPGIPKRIIRPIATTNVEYQLDNRHLSTRILKFSLFGINATPDIVALGKLPTTGGTIPLEKYIAHTFYLLKFWCLSNVLGIPYNQSCLGCNHNVRMWNKQRLDRSPFVIPRKNIQNIMLIPSPDCDP